MKYTGKLYGKIGREYIPLILTSEDVDAMEHERDELQQWKDSMLKIESEWDAHAVGRLLGLTIGTAIHPQIQPGIEKLLADKARLDWLADPENRIGNVQLPVGAVMENIESLRAAIDAAMSGNYEKNMPMVEPGYTSQP